MLKAESAYILTKFAYNGHDQIHVVVIKFL